MQSDESVWLNSVVCLAADYEARTVERFTRRLLALAESRLPQRVRRRVDPDDIVQSVFRSFFVRHRTGQFRFADAPDVWRLLAAMTFRKVQRTVRNHGRQQRDVSRETGVTEDLSDAGLESSVVVMLDLLDAIMSRLPERHQDILRLRLEERSIEEIAEQVTVSTRTVDRSLALVRQVAEELMAEEP